MYVMYLECPKIITLILQGCAGVRWTEAENMLGKVKNEISFYISTPAPPQVRLQHSSHRDPGLAIFCSRQQDSKHSAG